METSFNDHLHADWPLSAEGQRWAGDLGEGRREASGTADDILTLSMDSRFLNMSIL